MGIIQIINVIYFNPRARKERDYINDERVGVKEYISIHAPVKSATLQHPQTGRSRYDFNPRARKERDKISASSSSYLLNFNPRARKERD